VLLNYPSTAASERRNAEKENLLGVPWCRSANPSTVSLHDICSALGVPYVLPFGKRAKVPDRLAEQAVNLGLNAAALARTGGAGGAEARSCRISRLQAKSCARQVIHLPKASLISARRYHYRATIIEVRFTANVLQLSADLESAHGSDKNLRIY
jgi:hypothetical protein